MANRAEVAEQAALQSGIVALAWEQLQVGWAGLGLTGAALTSAAGVSAAQDLITEVISAWGELAGTAAADFYDELRAQSGVGGNFSALIPDPVIPAQIDGLTRWAVNTATPAGVAPTDADVAKVLTKLEGPTQRLVRQAQRTAIDSSAQRDPAKARVARVPSGDETCAFCLVLASRGPVYRSEASAGRDRDYHDFCDCEQVVVWTRDDQLPEGYDPGELYGKYEQARETAGTADLRKILAQLRLQEGIR